MGLAAAELAARAVAAEAAGGFGASGCRLLHGSATHPEAEGAHGGSCSNPSHITAQQRQQQRASQQRSGVGQTRVRYDGPFAAGGSPHRRADARTGP